FPIPAAIRSRTWVGLRSNSHGVTHKQISPLYISTGTRLALWPPRPKPFDFGVPGASRIGDRAVVVQRKQFVALPYSCFLVEVVSGAIRFRRLDARGSQ